MSCRARVEERLDEEADPADHERDPEDLLRGVLVAVAVAFLSHQDDSATPSSENGAEPSSIHTARRAWTWPELAVLRGAERLEDRAVDDVGADRDRRLEAEDEDSIGVISEPPPMPVMPTSRPIRSPASESFQSISAALGRRGPRGSGCSASRISLSVSPRRPRRRVSSGITSSGGMLPRFTFGPNCFTNQACEDFVGASKMRSSIATLVRDLVDQARAHVAVLAEDARRCRPRGASVITFQEPASSSSLIHSTHWYGA